MIFTISFIKNNFNVELLFTDTYSLTHEIKSENVYEEFFKRKDLFDFSNYFLMTLIKSYWQNEG